MNSGETSDSEDDATEDFVIPQYTDKEFTQAMQLLDLVILDIGSLSYKYSVLTASVVYHCQDEQAALNASGNSYVINLRSVFYVPNFISYVIIWNCS